MVNTDFSVPVTVLYPTIALTPVRMAQKHKMYRCEGVRTLLWDGAYEVISRDSDLQRLNLTT